MDFHPGFFLPPGWTKLFYSQAVEAVKYLLGLPEIMGIGLGPLGIHAEEGTLWRQIWELGR